nr:NADH-plastoquinone oxidoreductase subunit 5 [Sanicula orthacantha var. stolonifera]
MVLIQTISSERNCIDNDLVTSFSIDSFQNFQVYYALIRNETFLVLQKNSLLQSYENKMFHDSQEWILTYTNYELGFVIICKINMLATRRISQKKDVNFPYYSDYCKVPFLESKKSDFLLDFFFFWFQGLFHYCNCIYGIKECLIQEQVVSGILAIWMIHRKKSMYIFLMKIFRKKSNLKINRVLLLFIFNICQIFFGDFTLYLVVLGLLFFLGVTFFFSFVILFILFLIVLVLSVIFRIFFSISKYFVPSLKFILLKESLIVRLLIIGSFSWVVSMDSYTSLNLNNRVGFPFESSFFILLIKGNKPFLITPFFVSFESCRIFLVFSFKILRTWKLFFFIFRISFFTSFKIGLKKEYFWWVEPKGRLVCVPQTVKKQNFFCSFFSSLLEEKGDRDLDLCQGFKKKGNTIFICIPSLNQFFGSSSSDTCTPSYVHIICFSLFHSWKSSVHSGGWDNKIRPIFLTIINEDKKIYFLKIDRIIKIKLLIACGYGRKSQASVIFRNAFSFILFSSSSFSRWFSSSSFCLFFCSSVYSLNSGPLPIQFLKINFICSGIFKEKRKDFLILSKKSGECAFASNSFKIKVLRLWARIDPLINSRRKSDSSESVSNTHPVFGTSLATTSFGRLIKHYTVTFSRTYMIIHRYTFVSFARQELQLGNKFV